MKKLNILGFTFCQWQFYSIALTATTPSLSDPGHSLNNLLLYDTIFPYNNTTPLNLNARPQIHRPTTTAHLAFLVLAQSNSTTLAALYFILITTQLARASYETVISA